MCGYDRMFQHNSGMPELISTKTGIRVAYTKDVVISVLRRKGGGIIGIVALIFRVL